MAMLEHKKPIWIKKRVFNWNHFVTGHKLEPSIAGGDAMHQLSKNDASEEHKLKAKRQLFQ